MNENNNINRSNNENSTINIDKRMLPLFSTPVQLKKLNDQKINKYNFDILNPQKKLTYKVISLKEILELFLKGINLYNLNLNKYLLSKNKLNLILALNTNPNPAQPTLALPLNPLSLPSSPCPNGQGTNGIEIGAGRAENYKVKFSLNKLLYSLKRFNSVYTLDSLLYKLRLFLPGRLLKPQANIIYKYRTSNLDGLQLLVDKEIYTLELNNSRKEINELIEKGTKLEKDLDYLINQSKNKIINLNVIKELTGTESNEIRTIVEHQIDIEKDSREVIKKENNLVPSLSSPRLLGEGIQARNPLGSGSLVGKGLDSLEYKEETNKNKEEKILEIIKKTLANKKEDNTIKDLNIVKNIDSNFDIYTDTVSVNTNPVSVVYTNKNSSPGLGLTGAADTENKPILNQYLKSMSNYNMQSKGIFIFYSNIVSFNFNSETNKLIKNIYSLLAGSFKSMYCLISKPVFVITPDKIIIQLFYYLFIPNILKFKKIHKAVSQGYNNRSKLKKRKIEIKKQYRKFRKIKIKVRIKLRQLSNMTLSKVYPIRIKKLCELLSNLFQKPVELDLIRLHYPYNDSNILVNLLGIMINKIKLRIIIRKLFEKAVIKNLNKITGKTKLNIIPAFLSGINIRVAGRLLTHRVIPRQTIKITRRGASARGKINYSDVARYTNKNKRGAFSITVSSGQNFFN